MHARMWLVTLMLLAVTSLVGAQRRSTPVKVEFEPPPTAMQQGETTTTRLVFRALTDVDRLQVSITPLRGGRAGNRLF